MGAVYRAEDTKLGREVAIKVLPEEFTANTDRLARFEREARALAALNHPNIAGIYEVGEAETGLHYLVMELAEGEDLAARLSRGSIPADEALPLALQMAEALEAAHDKGIVHRDLKPGNHHGRGRTTSSRSSTSASPRPTHPMMPRRPARNLTHSPNPHRAR